MQDLIAAAAACLEALALKPDSVDLLQKLACLFEARGRPEPAIQIHRRILTLQPANDVAHLRLGNLLLRQGRTAEAIDSFRGAIVLGPATSDAHKGLIGALERAGRLDEALVVYRQAISRWSNESALQSGRLYLLLHDSKMEPGRIFDEHKAWGQRFESPGNATTMTTAHENDRSPDRRLRIGYVSPDFRDHANGRFIEPLIAAHDATAFEVFCYSDGVKQDHATKRFQQSADVWREMGNLDDQHAAAMIREDRIDILIDPTGHMAGNRLTLFALRPAPLQVALPVYPASTGLAAMDYAITDDWIDPPGEGEKRVTGEIEKALRSVWRLWNVAQGELAG